jgi:hypothetical protein
MAKLNYNPKMYGTVTNIGSSSYIPKNELLFENETKTDLIPKAMTIIDSNFQIGTKLNNVMPVVNYNTKTEADFIVFGIIDNPTNKQLHNQIDVDIDIHRKQYVNNTLMTDIQVERVGKTIDKDTTIVGYPAEIHPFLTYNFTSPEHIRINPFITYNVSQGITVDDIPFLTYIDYDFGGKNRQKIYYLVLYNKFMDKIIKCKMYDDTQGFPIQNVHLTMACSDGKHRYIPLNHVNEDFDSGARCQDKFGHIFQICTGRQESIINKYFPFGNMIIPLDSYENLYTILVGIFGTAHVSMGEDKKSVYFSPPSARAGITKMFLMGLNIRVTTEYDYELTTYNNGLNHTSYGGDYHKVANAMLIKMNSREKFKIEFDDTYLGITYPADAPVKNALVLGTTVEALNDVCDNYVALIHNDKWFIYNTETNYINIVDSTNKIVSYFKKNYLKYTNSKDMYNYFDLQKMKYEYDKFGKVLNK